MKNKNLLTYLLISVVAIGIFCLGRCHPDTTQYDHDVKVWQDSTKKLLAYSAQVDQVVNVRDSIIHTQEDIANKQTKRIAQLNLSATALRKKNDALLAQVKKDTSAQCELVMEVAEGYKAEADSLWVVNTELERRDTTRVNIIKELKGNVADLTVDRNKWKDQALHVPVYTPPKFLGFIPYPNRKLSFITGAIVGGVAVAQLVK